MISAFYLAAFACPQARGLRTLEYEEPKLHSVLSYRGSYLGYSQAPEANTNVPTAGSRAE